MTRLICNRTLSFPATRCVPVSVTVRFCGRKYEVEQVADTSTRPATWLDGDPATSSSGRSQLRTRVVTEWRQTSIQAAALSRPGVWTSRASTPATPSYGETLEDRWRRERRPKTTTMCGACRLPAEVAAQHGDAGAPTGGVVREPAAAFGMHPCRHSVSPPWLESLPRPTVRSSMLPSARTLNAGVLPVNGRLILR